MTFPELISLAAEQPITLALLLGLIPLLALLLPLLHFKGQGEQPPFSYFYALLTYLSCLPGMLVVALFVYGLIWSPEHLLDVNPSLAFLPLEAMLLTLGLIRRQISRFSELPGIDGLAGLMLLLAASLLMVLAAHQLIVGVLFDSSVIMLLLISAVVFLLLKQLVKLLFRQPRDEHWPGPAFFK